MCTKPGCTCECEYYAAYTPINPDCESDNIEIRQLGDKQVSCQPLTVWCKKCGHDLGHVWLVRYTL